MQYRPSQSFIIAMVFALVLGGGAWAWHRASEGCLISRRR